MDTTYLNHYSYTAQSWWERRSFVVNWWRLYAGDPKWLPPSYPALRRALEPSRNSHLARMSPCLIYTKALPKRQRKAASVTVEPLFEQPVAATVALADPRRRDGTAYLALLQGINDADSLKRLLEYVAESLRARGYRRLIGPTGISPHLGSGLLQDYWHHLPPLHTPYNPPYLPEIAESVLRPLARSQLYHLDIPAELSSPPATRARSRPFEPARLSRDLLPLLAAACPAWAGFVPPDTEEAEFLLRWLRQWPLYAWLAEVNKQPVGFVLLQPDLAPRLRRARGGRNPLWQLWLTWAGHRPVRHGRVLFAGVLPDWQGQGIARQLLHQALLTGQQLGWQSLSIGPLPGTALARKFLEHHGAEARQTYLLYQWEM